MNASPKLKLILKVSKVYFFQLLLRKKNAIGILYKSENR